MYQQFINHLISVGFNYIDRGASRAVYGRGNVVIKVPISYNSNFGIELYPSVSYAEKGIECNEAEDRAWHRYKNSPTKYGVKLAPCRLLSNGCLLMKKVQTLNDTVDEEDNINEWSWRIDGQQVGLYKDTIVAYDYADDVI